MQTFQHLTHESYACEGPYIRDWMKGAASWHPSIVAHNMRGSQHAYFWLLNFAEAIADLKTLLSHRAMHAVQLDVQHRGAKFDVPISAAKHKSAFPDDAKCYTDYEPRPVREASLKSKVVSGLAVDGKPGKT